MSDIVRKIYWAVAYFPQSNEYGVLPMNWLLEKTVMITNEMYCLWPSNPNITGEFIIRADPPDLSWLIFRVKIIVNKPFNNFIQAWNHLLILIESPLKDIPLISEKRVRIRIKNPRNDIVNNEYTLSQLLEVPMSIDLPNDELITDQEWKIMNIPKLTNIEEVDNVAHLNNLDINNLLYEIYNGGINIKYMLTEVLSTLGNLQNTFANMQLPPPTKNVDAHFLKKFPLNNSDELQHIEECILKDEFGFGLKLETYIKTIGGSCFKNHVVRVLSKFITDEYAVKCTWTGRGKGKVTKIRDTCLIMILKRVLQEHYAPQINTDYEFEKIVASWLKCVVSRHNKSKF